MLRLEPATGLKTCSFCSREICDDIKYGQLFKLGDNGVHQFCLLLSWNITHYRSPGEDVIEFDRREVYNVLEESRSIICVYCKEYGATLRCFKFNCDKTFHLPCGLENDSMHLFFKHYETYCSQHRIIQEVPSDLETQESMICAICQDGIIGKVSSSTLWASCCAKQTWFHRECVQRHAFHAGLEMRCPCCNDEHKFKEEMSKQGICITNECPSWLGGRMVGSQGFVNMCAAGSCNCPYGRSFGNGEWILRVCVSCTVRRIHRYCGRRGLCGQCYESANNGSDDESMHNHPPTVDDFDAFHENREFALGPLLEPERYFRALIGMPVVDIPDLRPLTMRNIPPLVGRRSSLDNMSVSDVLSNESSFEEDEDIVRQLFTDEIADNLSSSDRLGTPQTRSLGITDLVHRVGTNSENQSDDITMEELFTAHNIQRAMEEYDQPDLHVSPSFDEIPPSLPQDIEPYSLWASNRSVVSISPTATSDNSLFSNVVPPARPPQALHRALVTDNENLSLHFANNLSTTTPGDSSLFSYFRNGNDFISERTTRVDTTEDASPRSSTAEFEDGINRRISNGSGSGDYDYRIYWPVQPAVDNTVNPLSDDQNAPPNSEVHETVRCDPLSVTFQRVPTSASNEMSNEIDNREVPEGEIRVSPSVLVDGRKNIGGVTPSATSTSSPSIKDNTETRTNGIIRRGFINSRVIINSPLERMIPTTSHGQSSNSSILNAQSTYTPLPALPPSFLRGSKNEASSSGGFSQSHIDKMETDQRIPQRGGLHPVNTNGRSGIAPLPSFLRNRTTNINASQNSVAPVDNTLHAGVEGNTISVDRRFRNFRGETAIPAQISNSRTVEILGRRNENNNGNLRNVIDNTQSIDEWRPPGRGNLSSLEHFNIGMAVGMGIMSNERNNTARSTALSNDRISERHLGNHYNHQQQRTVPIYRSLSHSLPLPQPLPIRVLNEARNSTRMPSNMYSQSNNNGLMLNDSCNQRFGNYACLLCCVECGHSQDIMLPQYYPAVPNRSRTENVQDCTVRTE